MFKLEVVGNGMKDFRHKKEKMGEAWPNSRTG